MLATDASPAVHSPERSRYAPQWLFSAPIDLGVFLGSAVISLLALAVGARYGLLDADTPEWAWVPAVLLIDVAHVWSTAFRVYFDPTELRRRPLLYAFVPVAALVIGMALYSEGELLFWRTLAYIAVFHFVRQQYGWVALYRARNHETDSLGRWIDTIAIYLATVYPLLYWHAHLPRRFWWLTENDWQLAPAVAEGALLLERIAAPLYWAALAAYAARAVYLWCVLRRPNPGKDVVVATTAVCWYVGIVTFNSDYAFTVTNVVIHGVPYFALVYWYWQKQTPAERAGPGRHFRGLIVFFATVWALAYIEELFWHRGVGVAHDHTDRAWLFGAAWQTGDWKGVLAPLLAVPQLTHYILDGFIWRRRSNPDFTLVGRTESGATNADG